MGIWTESKELMSDIKSYHCSDFGRIHLGVGSTLQPFLGRRFSNGTQISQTDPKEIIGIRYNVRELASLCHEGIGGTKESGSSEH